jgi:hypothetical protein
MSDNKELIKAYIDITISFLKHESTQTYEELIYKAHKSILLLFSGTLIVFFINTDQLIKLSGKGATIWSIIFFTLAVLIQWIKYLPKHTVQNFRPVIEKFFAKVTEKVDELENLDIERHDYLDALVEKLKETQIGIKLLTSLRESANLKTNDEKQDFVQIIDEILYSERSGSQIWQRLKGEISTKKKK